MLANTATPMMWLTFQLLLVGNAFIGLIEALVIAKLFRAPLGKSIILLIIANYASMWAGAFLFGVGEGARPIADNIFEIPLYHVGSLLWVCAAIAFVMSLIIEWPFFWLAMRTGDGRLPRTIQATVVAQVVSYTLLGFLAAGTNTIGDEVEVASSREVVPASLQGTIYFVDVNSGELCEIGLRGENFRRRGQLPPGGRHDVLTWKRDEEQGGFILHYTAPLDVRGTETQCSPFFELGDAYPDETASSGFWLRYLAYAELRRKDERQWKVQSRGNGGLFAENAPSGGTITVKFDSVFQTWTSRCVTLLPEDLVVFELGRQICVLSLRDRTIACVARGTGPVVRLEHPPGS